MGSNGKGKKSIGSNLLGFLGGIRIKKIDNDAIKKLALDIANKLDDYEKLNVNSILGESPYFDWVKNFFDTYYNEIYKSNPVIVTPSDKVNKILKLLVVFNPAEIVISTETEEKEVTSTATEEKEVTSTALNAQDLAILLDALTEFEGRENERELYLKRLFPEDKYPKLAEMIKQLQNEVQKTQNEIKVADTKKVGVTKISREPVDRERHDGENLDTRSSVFVSEHGMGNQKNEAIMSLMASEIVKEAHRIASGAKDVSPDEIRSVLTKISAKDSKRIPTTAEVKSAISEHLHESGNRIGILRNVEISVGGVMEKSSILDDITAAASGLVAKKVTYTAADKMINKILEPANARDYTNLIRKAAEQAINPNEVILTQQGIATHFKDRSRPETSEEILQIDKSIKGLGVKIYIENPTIAFIASSSFANQQIDRETRLLSNGTQVKNLPPEDKVKAREALLVVAEISKKVATDEKAVLVRLTVMDKSFDSVKKEIGDTKLEMAINDTAALVAFANMNKTAELTAEKFHQNTLILDRFGISTDSMGKVVSSTKKAVDVIRDPRSKVFFQDFKKNILSSKYAGSILSTLNSGKAGKIINFTSKVLNIKEEVYTRVISYLAKRGMVQGAKTALMSLAGKIGVREIAGQVAAKGLAKTILTPILATLGIATGPPGWLAAAVSWVVTELAFKIKDKFVSVLKREGLLQAIFTAPAIVVGATIEFVAKIFGAFAIINLSVIFAVVLVSMFMGIFLIQAFNTGVFQSTLMPVKPAPTYSFLGVGIDTVYPPDDSVSPPDRSNVPEGCPSGWPLKTPFQVTQGAYGRFSHRIIDAIDMFGTRGDLFMSPIYATHTGKVSAGGGEGSSYGFYVTISSICEGLPVTTWYAHMPYIEYSRFASGTVKRGDVIGHVDNSGTFRSRNSTSHLHYEVRGGNFKLNDLLPKKVPIGCFWNCGVYGP